MRPAPLRSVPDPIVEEEKAAARELEQWVDLDDLGLIPFADLGEKSPPDRDWMVENCFLRGTVALVSGDGGVGKSLLLQQLFTCACVGRPWIGHRVERGHALYIACEDDMDELWRRQASINRHYDLSMVDLAEGGLQVWPRVGQDNAMMYLERSTWQMTPTPLFDRVVRRCKRDGITYVGVDTATQTFRGNQNDEIQVMDYISAWRRVAVQIQGVVIIAKHPSMSGRALGTGESGNVAWSNSVRSRFYLHKAKDTGKLVWEGKKSNYGPVGETTPLRWEKGVFVVDEPEPSYDERYYQR